MITFFLRIALICALTASFACVAYVLGVPGEEPAEILIGVGTSGAFAACVALLLTFVERMFDDD